MKSIFTSIVNVIFPKVCAGCHNLLNDNEKLICSYCRYEMPKTNFLNVPNNEAFKKFYGIVNVEKVAALLYFEKNGITQNLLHQLKYKNQPELGALLANMFEDDLNNANFFADKPCIIPVPLHPKKYKERGYNQVHTFAETLAKNHDLELNKNVLIRSHYNKTQTRKNLNERNVYEQQTFSLTNETPVNTNFVLIDDVLTTGATLIQCIKTLQKIPNAKVSVLTIAYTH